MQNEKVKVSKRILKKQHKRAALIEAAIKVFSEKGFHNVRVSEIAAEAGVADGTTYLYFKNKDDLMIQAVEELFDKKLKEMENRINQEKNGRDKLFRFAEEHIKIFTAEPQVVRFLGVELRQSKEFYKKYPDFKPLRKYLHYLQEIITEAVEEGFIRQIDVLTLSYMIFGTVNFIITEWAVQDKPFSLEQVKDSIEDILRFGLLKTVKK